MRINLFVKNHTDFPNSGENQHGFCYTNIIAKLYRKVEEDSRGSLYCVKYLEQKGFGGGL